MQPPLPAVAHPQGNFAAFAFDTKDAKYFDTSYAFARCADALARDFLWATTRRRPCIVLPVCLSHFQRSCQSSVVILLLAVARADHTEMRLSLAPWCCTLARMRAGLGPQLSSGAPCKRADVVVFTKAFARSCVMVTDPYTSLFHPAAC
jgi:hypothetical protein